LAKEPEDRPPSAEWLATRLAEYEVPGEWTPERARRWWEANRGFIPAAGEVTRTAVTPSPLAAESERRPGASWSGLLVQFLSTRAYAFAIMLGTYLHRAATLLAAGR
jgi:hypothetical protein